MGFFYTLGINFDDEQVAKACKLKMESYIILLSDLSVVPKYCRIDKSILPNGRIQFVLLILPNGLQYVTGDKKLGSPVFFYEIRSRLYEFLLSPDLCYNYAFFEFEGADYFSDVDIIAYLNTYGIGEIQQGDSNAASIAKNEPNDFASKRLLDGLILSNALFKGLENRFDFKKFNENYMWLPIII